MHNDPISQGEIGPWGWRGQDLLTGAGPQGENPKALRDGRSLGAQYTPLLSEPGASDPERAKG